MKNKLKNLLACLDDDYFNEIGEIKLLVTHLYNSGFLSGRLARFGTGGNCMVNAVQLQDRRWILFNNITETIALSKVPYRQWRSLYNAFWDEDDETGELHWDQLPWYVFDNINMHDVHLAYENIKKQCTM